MDIHNRAHDLAVLYMQLEIKEGKIETVSPDDWRGFIDEYLNLYQAFVAQLASH